MELAHDNDSILAVFLEQGIDLPAVARRVNMSLAALANWAAANASLLNDLHQLLVTRCKLLAAQIELAALSALASVAHAATNTDEPRLRERALERQRKAASAILRHRAFMERPPGSARSTRSRAPGSATAPNDHAHGPPPIDAASDPLAASSSMRTPLLDKPSLAQRLAAGRLASQQPRATEDRDRANHSSNRSRARRLAERSEPAPSSAFGWAFSIGAGAGARDGADGADGAAGVPGVVVAAGP